MAKVNYRRKYTQQEVQDQDMQFEMIYYQMRREGADEKVVEAARTLWVWAMDETAKWRTAVLHSDD